MIGADDLLDEEGDDDAEGDHEAERGAEAEVFGDGADEGRYDQETEVADRRDGGDGGTRAHARGAAGEGEDHRDDAGDAEACKHEAEGACERLRHRDSD